MYFNLSWISQIHLINCRPSFQKSKHVGVVEDYLAESKISRMVPSCGGECRISKPCVSVGKKESGKNEETSNIMVTE